MTDQKYVALYARVSSHNQDPRSQVPDLHRWSKAQDEPVRRYLDKQSGTTMDRPDWARLEADKRLGPIRCPTCGSLARALSTARTPLIGG